jgi:MFS family permease
MVPGCLIFSILASRFGLKKILIIGTLGYAPYAASLYVNNRYGVEWFVLLGATLCGISASALWASEGAIAVGYPLVHERGMYTGIWLGLRQLGQVIGASIQLSLNVGNNQRGSVGYQTYLVLVALQCLGLPLAFLSSPPHKAIRSDGTRVATTGGPKKEIKVEVKKMWALLKEKRIYLLIPVLITFDWNRTYQGIYLTRYFTVRSRALMYWIVGTFDADVETITLSVGIVRAFESVGSALAFGIGAARVQPMVNLTIAFVAFAVCIVPTYMVTFMVPDHPSEHGKSTEEVARGVAEA